MDLGHRDKDVQMVLQTRGVDLSLGLTRTGGFFLTVLYAYLHSELSHPIGQLFSQTARDSSILYGLRRLQTSQPNKGSSLV